MLAAVTVFQGVICKGKDAESIPGKERRVSVATHDAHSICVLPVQICLVDLETWCLLTVEADGDVTRKGTHLRAAGMRLGY